MKTSIIILYVAIAAVVLYLIYKAYTNYGLSGNIFSTVPMTTTSRISYYDTNPTNRITYYDSNPDNVSRFVATDGASKSMNGNGM